MPCSKCPAFAEQQVAFWQAITGVLGEATVAQLQVLPADHQLLCILGDAEWGPLAVGVDAVVQRYLLRCAISFFLSFSGLAGCAGTVCGGGRWRWSG